MRSTPTLPLALMTILGACAEIEELGVEQHADGDINSDTHVDDVSVEAVDVRVSTDITLAPHIDLAAFTRATPTAETDGVAFSLVDLGIFGGVQLTPMLSPERLDDVAALQFELTGVQFAVPQFYDNASNFAWGDPLADGTYLLVVRSIAPFDGLFAWQGGTTFCDDQQTCHARSLDAVCEADIVMRVWSESGDETRVMQHYVHGRPDCLLTN